MGMKMGKTGLDYCRKCGHYHFGKNRCPFCGKKCNQA